MQLSCITNTDKLQYKYRQVCNRYSKESKPPYMMPQLVERVELGHGRLSAALEVQKLAVRKSWG